MRSFSTAWEWVARWLGRGAARATGLRLLARLPEPPAPTRPSAAYPRPRNPAPEAVAQRARRPPGVDRVGRRLAVKSESAGRSGHLRDQPGPPELEQVVRGSDQLPSGLTDLHSGGADSRPHCAFTEEPRRRRTMNAFGILELLPGFRSWGTRDQRQCCNAVPGAVIDQCSVNRTVNRSTTCCTRT